MVKDINKAMSNVPAHIAALMAREGVGGLGDNLSGGLSTGGAPRISIKASRFHLVEGGASIRLKDTELDVIIVGAATRLSKTYYAKAWDSDEEPEAPDCYSMDGVYPDTQIANPVNDVCATCPMNQWGSKVTPAGKQIKACADQKRLAVVAAGDPGTVYLVQTTPAALQGLAKYAAELKARGLQPDWVITTLSFDEEASFPKLVFSYGGFPDAEALAAVGAIEPIAITRVISGDMSLSDVKAIEGPAAPAQPKLKARAAAEDDDEEEVAPPAKPKVRPKLVVDNDDDEEEEEVAPPAKPKRKPVAAQPAAKPKAKAPVVDDDEDDEDDATIAAFSKRKPKADAEVTPKPKRKPIPAAVEMNDDEDEDAAPATDKKMRGLVDAISSRLGGFSDEDEDEDEDSAA